jgi:hypothetical protein
VNAAESIKQKAKSNSGGEATLREYTARTSQAVQAVEPHDPAHGRAGGGREPVCSLSPTAKPDIWSIPASVQRAARAVRGQRGTPTFHPRDGARRRGEGFQAFQAFQAYQAFATSIHESDGQPRFMDSPPPFPHGQPRSHPLHPNDVSALARPPLTALQYQ